MGEFARISCTMPGLFFTIPLLIAFRGVRSKPSGATALGLHAATTAWSMPSLEGRRGRPPHAWWAASPTSTADPGCPGRGRKVRASVGFGPGSAADSGSARLRSGRAVRSAPRRGRASSHVTRYGGATKVTREVPRRPVRSAAKPPAPGSVSRAGDQALDLGLAIPAVAAECADRIQLACLRPPSDRLGVDSEQGGDLRRGQQTLSNMWLNHQGTP